MYMGRKDEMLFVILQQMLKANIVTLADLRGVTLATFRRYFAVGFLKRLPQREIIYISRFLTWGPRGP